MKNNGQSEYSIKFANKALTFLSQHTNLDQPEQVKQFIANRNVSNGYKRNLSIAYNKYCKYYNITWEMPLYKQESKAIKIPTKEKIEMLIAYAGKTLSAKLTLSMETGLRPIELHNLKVKDVDLEQKLVYPNTAKNGASRKLKISEGLRTILQDHINTDKLNPNNKLFQDTAEGYGKHFRAMRNRLANKLHDQTIKNIRLYDLRHYFATTLYAKTRDPFLVKQQMGHKKFETTLIYTQLLDFSEDEYTIRTADTIADATPLLESGFEYVTEIDGHKVFRKRK